MTGMHQIEIDIFPAYKINNKNYSKFPQKLESLIGIC